MNKVNSYINKGLKSVNAITLAALLTGSSVTSNTLLTGYIPEPKNREYNPAYSCFVVQKGVHNRIYQAMEKLSPNVDGNSEDLGLILKDQMFSMISLPGGSQTAVSYLDSYCKAPHKPTPPEIDKKIGGHLEDDIRKYGTYKIPKKK